MVKIIVDSTCDLPDEIMAKYDIKLLPLRVNLNGKDFLDKVTIKVEEVYDAMRKGIWPMTSQPSPRSVYQLFQDCISNGYNFIYLAFSSKLSGTYETINGIIRDLQEKCSNIKMDIVDTKSGSTATGLIALQAAKMVEAGKSFETVVDASKELAEHVEHIFTIDDLNWLIKGGRISKGEAIIGNILNIKPILHVNDGVMEVIHKVRGRKKALNTIMDIIEERIKNFPDQIIGISHADDMETAIELKNMILDRIGNVKIIITKIGSVLGSHLGIGGVGVFFFNERNELYID